MKTLKFLFLLSIAFVSCQVKGQSQLSVVIDSFPTHFTLGDTNTYQGSVYIKNYGPSAFGNGDSLYLQYQINGQVYNATNPDSGIYLAEDTISIAVGDSVKKQLSIHFTRSIFQYIGSSGVVIWPIALASTPFDSASYQPQVSYPSGIGAVSPQNLLVYINQQQLYINTNVQNLIKRVRIYDLQGQLLIEQAPSSSTIIAMNKYAQGCYLVEVILNDDSRKVYKVVDMDNR